MKIGILCQLSSQSTQALQQAIGISKSSIDPILWKCKRHPCKIQDVHSLNEDGPDRMIEYSLQ